MAGQVAPILLQPKEIENAVNFVLNIGEFARSFIPLLTHGLTYMSGMIWNYGGSETTTKSIQWFFGFGDMT